MDDTEVIEKMGNALEATANEVVALKKQLAEVQTTPGPQGIQGEKGERGVQGVRGEKGMDGKDADPVVVAEVLVKTYADELRGPQGIPGEKGAPGEAGKSVSAAEVAIEVVSKHAEVLRGPQGVPGEQGPQGLPGEAGKSVEVADVVATLVEKHAATLKGAPGDKGERGEKGDKGDSVSVVEVAGELVSKHADLLRGQDGTNGVDGKDGKDADPAAVAVALAKDFRDILRGEKGADGESRLILDTEVKAYEPGIHRKDTLVTHFSGQMFRALKDTAAEPGTDDWERIGTAGFRFREDNKADAEGDLFIKDYSLWGRLGGQDRLLVGRPKVDYKHLSSEVVKADGFEAVTKAAEAKAADSAKSVAEQIVGKLVEAQVAQSVAVYDEEGRQFLVVNGKAVDITPVNTALIEEVATLKAVCEGYAKQLKAMTDRLAVLEAK